MRLIDADALISDTIKTYCADCDRRKGMKRGKMVLVYDIGDAPCRACGTGDMLEALEDAPTVNAITMEWMNDKLDETAETNADLNNALFWVMSVWTKEQMDGGEKDDA